MGSPELKTAGPGHAMVQRLLLSFGTKRTMEPADERNLVSRNEALVALLIASAAVDANFQSGSLDEGIYDTVVALGQQIPISHEPNNLPVRGYYVYETDNAPATTPTPFWDWNIFGFPLWVIVVFVVCGVFIPVYGGVGRGGNRGGGRSGGGGSSGKW